MLYSFPNRGEYFMEAVAQRFSSIDRITAA